VPDSPRLRVYLDANVLFSASLSDSSRFLEFWRLHNVTPVTSRYAVGEVMRNLRFYGHDKRFEDLLARTQIISDADVRFIPPHIALVAKDAPILAVAISASVDYLATGDKNHFAHLYKTTVAGVYVISPADFLNLYKDRLVR
jgi:predicted nucleic acid-binding protein